MSPNIPSPNFPYSTVVPLICEGVDIPTEALLGTRIKLDVVVVVVVVKLFVVVNNSGFFFKGTFFRKIIHAS